MYSNQQLSSPLLDMVDNDDAATDSATSGSGEYWKTPNYHAITESSLNYSSTVPLNFFDEQGGRQDGADEENEENDDALDSSPKTSSLSTFIHLLKGYVGPGCLSLPWAMSQMGVIGGTFAIAIVSFWTSYNCYTIVKIKRYIERSAQQQQNGGMKKSSSATSLASSALTYPDIGEWAFGETFEQFISTAVCVQQLSVCTVFFSFIGENIHAVGQLIQGNVPILLSTHVGVMTVALPFIMALTFIRSLKALTPIMVFATILLFAGFGIIGYSIFAVWANRPREAMELEWTSVPLAICAVLYSYEGICLILPIESAMKHPKQFKKVFGSAMTCVAVIFAIFANVCVYAFGSVDNGSITAFLLEKYKDDNHLIVFVMAANIAVSLSVLFTYPLQLFPTIELLGPKISKLVWKLTHRREVHYQSDNNFDEFDLTGFERMPPLPENEEASLSSHDNARISEYNTNTNQINDGFEECNDDESIDDVRASLISNITEALSEQIAGDSLPLRMILVFGTYLVAVIIPNVQALISLAGALSGSSTALLVPPILELALIEHLESLNDATTSPGPPSRHRPSFLSRLCNISGKKKKFQRRRLKCVFLFWIGIIFLGIGTYASISDIIRIWLR